MTVRDIIMCRWISISIVFILSTIGKGLGDKVLIFQSDTQLSNESRALLYLTPELLRPQASLIRESVFYEHEENVDADDNDFYLSSDVDVLSDLSVCLWVKVFYFRKTTSYVFSYATSDKDNNELNFGMTYERILMAIGGKYLYGTLGNIYTPDTWYHICFVASSQSRTGTFYINGEFHKSSPLSPRNILINGSLVLGQETDKVDGGYQALQSFSGAITKLNLYSRVLSVDEIKLLSKCSGDVEEGDLVAWTTARWTTFGSVDIEEINEEEICVKKRMNFVVFSKKRTYEQMKHYCKNLKSYVALPRDQVENEILFTAAEPFVDQCQPHNHATAFFWLGATSPSKGQWIDSEGNDLTFDAFDGRSTSRSCAGLKIPDYRGEWHDVSCSPLYRFCGACQEEKPAILRLRGLCDSSPQEGYFRLVDQYGEMPFFKGFIKYNIVYDNNGTWALIDAWTDMILATFFTFDEEIPFGRKTWTTATNFDLCQKPANETHDLALSACYDWEYPCNDGTCIRLSQRCDMRVDCPDNSDETACEKLVPPVDYLESLPPPGVTLGAPVYVNVSVDVQGFSEINIRDMKLVVDFGMEITWADSRLRYKNLKSMADLNFIKTNSVWTPRVELLNADFPNIHTTKAVLNILRLSEPEEDDLSRISRDEIYEGSVNSLRLAQKFNAPFSCVMNMKNFPFDRQHCQLLIRFASAKKDFLEWDHLLANYTGEVLLAEYEVEDISVKKQLDNDYSMVIVEITFSRRYGYYLTSAYLPTIMLMIISYASLFCKRDNCDLRVMMALTTLLVLYALYQQISDDLPRTSYTKAIDVWCFFAITFIFSQVILHVLVDVKVSKPMFRSCLCVPTKVKEVRYQGQKNTSTEKISHENAVILNNGDNNDAVITRVCPDDECEDKRLCHSVNLHPLVIARIFYVFLFGTFCAIYWTVVLSSE